MMEMPPMRRRANFNPLTEFDRGMIKGLREAEIRFRFGMTTTEQRQLRPKNYRP